ncbi:MAG TPA: GNAT family N-acetyltransferase [Candidatus Limnocylindrales bacterium]|nr:GNAT family N-acetyltransferase [Candidatus Limnocylindrales bacterium]
MTGVEGIGAPEHLTPEHDVTAFASGVSALDEWLKRRALNNEKAHASRTYVVTAGGRVVAYYALANGAVALSDAPGRVRRNMPDPVPVMIIGRLAVDLEYQGRGIAQGLLRDAILRTIQAAEIAGIRAILVHAISEEAKRFYVRHGFVESTVAPMMLMTTVMDAQRALGSDK